MKNQNIAFRLKRKELDHASTQAEKLDILRELVQLNPKDPRDLGLRTKYKKELETLSKKTFSRAGYASSNLYGSIRYERQVVIIGESNTGKSTLLNILTKVSATVSDNPFTTYKPIMGMYSHKDVPIQIVEVPAIYEGEYDGNKIGFVRNSDVICITTFDKDSIGSSVAKLEDYLIIPSAEPAVPSGHKYKPKEQIITKPAFVASWHDFDYHLLNVVDISNKESVGAEMYRLLSVKRIYCIREGKIQGLPLVFPRDSVVTVADFAQRLRLNRKIHGARIYQSQNCFEGQNTGLDFVLNDGEGVWLK